MWRAGGSGARQAASYQRRITPLSPAPPPPAAFQIFISLHQTWVQLKIFLIRINLVSKTFDSTQLMTHNSFTGIGSNQLTAQNGFLKFDSNRLTTQISSIIF